MRVFTKYKNAFISLGSYAMAFLLTYAIPRFIWSYDSPPSPAIGHWIIGSSIVLVIIALFFAYKSNKSKESSWAGNLLMVIGIIIVFGVLLIQSVCTPIYNCE